MFGQELAGHRPEIKVNVLDLTLRIVAWKQACADGGWIVESSAPFVGANPLVTNLQHIARLGVVNGDRPDKRLRPLSRIFHSQPRQCIDRHARLQLIEKVRPSVGEADLVPRLDS